MLGGRKRSIKMDKNRKTKKRWLNFVLQDRKVVHGRIQVHWLVMSFRFVSYSSTSVFVTITEILNSFRKKLYLFACYPRLINQTHELHGKCQL